MTVDSATEPAPEAPEPASAGDAATPSVEPVEPGGAAGEATRFRPSGQQDLAPAGEVAKLRANLAALETLRAVQAAGRPATVDEQAVLARWSGWGAVPGVFEARSNHPNFERYAAERTRLQELLSPQEYRAAERNTLNAHYTDAAYVQAMWDGLRMLGFTGGRVLEPGCGAGNFIGLAPDEANMVGVEVEPVTAAIAQALYPQAQIRAESFADTRAPGGAFDAVVGNVPFGDFALTDKRHNPSSHSIHNHFIIKSLALTRPGGLVAVLTSRYTLDAVNPAARREMAALGDLVGAVRLPGNAHRATAGTSVVTDLLILRRRDPEAAAAGAGWERARPLEVAGGATVEINEYYADHPEHVLGELTVGRGMYRDDEMMVNDTGDLGPQLSAALNDIAAQAHTVGLTMAPADTLATRAIAPIAVLSDRDDGHLAALDDGGFTQVVEGQVQPHPVPTTQAPELRALLGLRDTVTALLSAEAATVDDTDELDDLRARLNGEYDAYVEAFGPINRYNTSEQRKRNPATGQVEPVIDPDTGDPRLKRLRPPMGGFRIDPYAPAVFALEDFNETTQVAAKADIFVARVIAPRSPRLGADSAEDALAICLDSLGEVRLEEVARLLGTEPEAARAALGELVFDDPDSVRLIEAPAYLSGNVRIKLDAARQAAADDPRFEPNVRALKRVIPRDLGPGEIEAALGASWIDAPYVEQFLTELLDDTTVKVRNLGGSDWSVKGGRHGVNARTTWGTSARSAGELAQAALRQAPIKVYTEIERDKRVFDPEATAAAQAKITELNERFAEWVWEDPQRTNELVRSYNDKLNALVIRSYEGVTRTMPGLSVGFAPRPHQVETVARLVNEPSVGIFHAVGAGKTLVMAMGTMELKRLGLVNKPAIVVPNSMLEQVTREFLWAYPQARLLAAGRDDMPAERRRRFVSRAATGNWDAIIMTAGFFERLGLSHDEQRTFLEADLDKLRDKIVLAGQQAIEDGENPARSGSVKQLQRALERREERIKKKFDGARDPGLTFEQTGIDYAIRDEAHELKNDMVASNIPDAAKEGVDRAIDFRMKMDYLRRTRNTLRVGSGATATPVANSVSELWVVMRQYRPDILEAAGLDDFDSWAATFGEVVTGVEVSPTGDGFRVKSRFAKFRNVPELMQMVRLFGDVRTPDDLNLPTPPQTARPEDGQRAPRIVPIERSPELGDFMAELDRRVEAVKSGAVDPTEDNMLKISSDARIASLDLRLIGRSQTTPGKIDAAADEVARIWDENQHTLYKQRDGSDHPRAGALQLVFSDLGTPHTDDSGRFTAYGELRDQLVERGIPRERIRFIQEANTDRKKGALFAACRNGEVDVLIGSTQMMGVGVNVQDRAIALHHLDCPWRPADVTQREGRILRQGNQNDEVTIYRYVVTGSFDAYMWQTVARKARFIDQVMRGKSDERSMEDIGDDALNYDQIKAIATGNPLLLDHATAATEVTRLERAERAHRYAQDALRRTIRDNRAGIAEDTTLVARYDQALTQRRDTRGDKFAMTVDGHAHTKRPDAGAAVQHVLAAAAKDVGRYEYRENIPVGHLAGFEVTATIYPGQHGTQLSLMLPAIPQAVSRLALADLGKVDPVGLIRRLEHHPTSVEAASASVTARIAEQEHEIERAASQLGRPFPKEHELTEARDKLAEIEAAMSAEAAPPAVPTTVAEPPEHQQEGTPPAEAAAVDEVASAAAIAAHAFPAPVRAENRPGPAAYPDGRPAARTAVAEPDRDTGR